VHSTEKANMISEAIHWPDLAPGARTVMHHGTFFGHSFEDVVQLARLAECQDVTLSAQFARDLLKERPAKEVLRVARDAGVEIAHLDPVLCWLPRWQPDASIGSVPLEVFEVSMDDVFRATDALEVQSISILGAFPQGSVELNEVVDHFGALCERAARHSIRCDIEFVPFFGISDLATAWTIIQQSGVENAGIMFDFWHYCRGNRNDTLLRSIPGDRITGVQFDDATLVPPPGRSLFEDTMCYRRPPGEGEMPIREITSVLREIGALNNIGPEILSTDLWAMPVEQAARRCRQSMAWALS
jgi:4-hydroxyphenylpyruvate dioxygenase